MRNSANIYIYNNRARPVELDGLRFIGVFLRLMAPCRPSTSVWSAFLLIRKARKMACSAVRSPVFRNSTVWQNFTSVYLDFRAEDFKNIAFISFTLSVIQMLYKSDTYVLLSLRDNFKLSK